MPEVTVRHEINTDENTYWGKLVFDEDFNKKLFVQHLGMGWELMSQKEDDAKVTRTVSVEPVPNIPASLKKLASKMLTEKLSYTEKGTFDKSAKRYEFEITPNLQLEKTRVTGEVWLEKVGEKKVARFCRVSVDVKILVVGSMVEERIVSELKASYDRAAQFINNHIIESGL
jgi:hypothetical protein